MDLIYVFDLEGRFTYANEALLSLWRRTWDDAIGKTCLELGYPPEHAAMHDREIRQVIETRQPVRGEVPFEGAHGLRIYEYIFVPVIGADGQGRGGGRLDPRHDRAAAIGRQSAAIGRASFREADRRKDEFLATLAHELRNPLAPIRNALEVMRLAGDEPETVEAIAVDHGAAAWPDGPPGRRPAGPEPDHPQPAGAASGAGRSCRRAAQRDRNQPAAGRSSRGTSWWSHCPSGRSISMPT